MIGPDGLRGEPGWETLQCRRSPFVEEGIMTGSRWWSIGGSLLVGLFVAYLDRTNLSVAIQSVARDLGFAGDRFPVVSSWALTIFLIGYALANIFGGIATQRFDP